MSVDPVIAAVTAAGPIVIGVVTVWFGRRQAAGDAEVKRATAEQIRTDTAIKASTAIRELTDAVAAKDAEHQQTRAILRAVLDANGEHEKWDQVVVEALRAMRDAMNQAGIVAGVGPLPDPPPLEVPESLELR